MNGRRSLHRNPPPPVHQDEQNNDDDTSEIPGSGGSQSNSWYLHNSVGNRSTISITSSSPMTSSTEEGQENGNQLVRGTLMFNREIVNRESSSTLSLGCTEEHPRTNVQRKICSIPCFIAVPIMCLPVYFSRAFLYAKDHISMEKFTKFILLVTAITCVAVYYLCVCKRSFDELSSQELTKLYQKELKLMWQSHISLEERTRDIEALKMEMDHLRDQFTGVNKSLLHSVKQVLEESDIPGEDKEQVLKMINSAIKKIYEDHVQMSDWAQKSIGATIDKKRTSKTYEHESTLWSCWLIPCFVISSAYPPETVLEPAVSPGNCWAFEGSEGQVVIKLPEKIHPMAVTVQHISKAIAVNGNVMSAPKSFMISGLDDKTGEETVLGTFMYDINEDSIQTFQLKKQHSKNFLYIKFKIQSNWGNPVFTCIYRLRVHGKMIDLLGSLKEGSSETLFR
ncbi:SUN domain-containing protein 3-like [Heteronotia binoei]|uniref:SUN domain-containing protein 3-like n=1 Tax=Heteronotia binoei TaxID=13085 RepID=UPI00292F73A1|nr:SUN domain-containing protein 3-like [Heteronotia binoei]XP_060093155.1 SUN domain-containing protein 3-like [Heteronotia binoei]